MAGHREGETAGGKQDRLQAQRLGDLTSRHSMFQQVDMVTHGVEILDLIWMNNVGLFSDIKTNDWPQFSDHKVVTANVTYKYCQDEPLKDYVFPCDTGRCF